MSFLRDSHLATIARVVVGAVLVFSAVTKLVHPAEFVAVVQAHEILPQSLAGPAAAILPWIELLLGSLVLFGLFTRPALLTAGVLLLFFLALMALAWMRGKDIDCGCFIGVIEETVGPLTLARDLVILALVVPAYLGLPHTLSLDHWLQERRSPGLRQAFAALGITVTAVAFGILMIALSSGAEPATASTKAWRQGPADAEVVITEFGDYQCGACQAMTPVLKELVADYNGQVALEYHHFPIPGHTLAAPAAEAAEAAGEQGRFWEMHELLFADQKHLSPADLRARAASLGLDLRKFDEAISSGRARKRVQADFEEGKRIGVWYTPWIMVNNQVVQPNSYANIKAAIERELSK